ncbi:MAG: pyridoxal-phosphate dependent enzyme [Saprospiraceae bacterium]
MAYSASKFNVFVPGPIQKIKTDWSQDQLFIKRLDLIQSWADGNKYYKLKNNIAYALEHAIGTIVSKGGMFSNHLYSLAHACSKFELDLVCVVRSYKPDHENPTIRELEALSKKIIYLSPEDYNHFDESEAQKLFPGSMFIPEGGMGKNAMDSMEELMKECLIAQPNHIIVAGGSMTTACGLIAASPEGLNIISVPAWKGCTDKYINDILLENNISPQGKWEIWNDAHHGGFASWDNALLDFMYCFTKSTNIPLDPIYTAKMMYAVKEKIKEDYFSKDDTILALHTGGLQGVRGFAHRYPEEWGGYEKLIESSLPL